MKKESEKKVPTAIRLSPNERRIVEEKAKTMEMSVTGYIRHMAVHGDENITPNVMVKIQNLVNHAHDVAKQINPDEALSLEEEANEIWSLLNSKQI